MSDHAAAVIGPLSARRVQSVRRPAGTTPTFLGRPARRYLERYQPSSRWSSTA